MRRAFLRLEVLAVVVVAVCLAVLSSGQKPSRAAQLELASGPGGSLTLSNDKEGSAILSLGGMRPGDSVTDTVTLGNTGSLDGDLSLSTSNLVDTPGGGGGALSGELDLRIRDVTNAGSPVIVYSGKLDALTPTALGTLAAAASRVYEFRVAFPDAGPGSENAYQGSAMSVEFDWTAVNNGPDLDPPETTITSAPSGLTASTDAAFTFTADEAGSTFECSLDGGGFSSCTSPASFSGLGDGAHTFDVRATDAASNTDPTPDSAAWTVDATAPNVSLADPGSPLRGTVTLNPAADDGSGSSVASLIVQRSPSGAGTWTTIATSWNTTGVADGTYDLRARATDNAGNAANSGVRTVVVDNTAPALVSSNPADGELVSSAGSLSVTANEDLAGIANAELDGAAAPAPVISGAAATYAVAFANGPHTLIGDLVDEAGNSRTIAIHFTAWALAAADYPWIEKNSFPSSAMTLTATNGEGAINVPAGAWSGAPSGDWLVVRIDPRPAAAVGNGFETAGDIYDVTAHWALADTVLHSFGKALDLTLPGMGSVVPATYENGAWRAIERIPTGTSLPSGWADGFYKSGSDIHILTKHLSTFSVLEDIQAPSKPGRFSGAKRNRHLVLKWKAATDNSLVGAYLVYANGSLTKSVSSSARSANLGRFKTSDSRSFQVAARDAAGNIGPKTRRVVIVPALKTLTLAKAQARLTARGLRSGVLSYVFSSTIAAGRIVSAPAGVVFKGSAVKLAVSKGPSGSSYTPPPPTTSSAGGTSGYGGSGTGSTGSTGGTTSTTGSSFAGTTGATSSGGSTPTSSTTGGPGSGSVLPTTGSGGSETIGGVEPESFSPAEDDPSSLRRLLGFTLLGGAFLAAGGVALRARRPRFPRVDELAAAEPLLFWDQRLLRAVASSVRRVTALF
jgi:hypothetical protein